MDYINKILCGNDLEILPKLPAESVNCVTTSSPYWGLRDYGIEPVIWDGDKDCKHEWGNRIVIKSYGNVGTHPNVGSQKIDAMKGSENKGQFCQKCSAWRGSLGLEPTFELYIKHLCDIFDQVKRVLRKDGTCWVNLGDSYGGSGGDSGKTIGNQRKGLHGIDTRPVGISGLEGNQKLTKGYEKSLLDIPYRFSIEMINRGWIKRNTIIWYKPNCMPSSADDRFTVDFEYLFFFTKNNKAIFWTNEKTLECVSKNPPRIKGIENKDWEWRPCTTCQGKGEIIGKALKDEASPIDIGTGVIDKNTKAFKICPRCKGSGKIKYSFWTGHDYWFDQQFDDIAEATIKRAKYNWCSPGTKSFNHPSGLNRNEPYKNHINFNQGRNKRCVWIIPTQPFPEAHFAVYPEGLIEIPIKAGCPEFVCKKCGKARMKIYERQIDFRTEKSDTKYIGLNAGNLAEKRQAYRKLGYESPPRPKEIGYTDCGCNAGWESGIVLDPFMGAGTTALVALKQRKRFIGIEIKQSYIDMSYKRISNVQQNIF